MTGYLHLMWVEAVVCGLSALHVGPFAAIVGLRRGLFADNAVAKQPLFVGPTDLVCEPLQVGMFCEIALAIDGQQVFGNRGRSESGGGSVFQRRTWVARPEARGRAWWRRPRSHARRPGVLGVPARSHFNGAQSKTAGTWSVPPPVAVAARDGGTKIKARRRGAARS